MGRASRPGEVTGTNRLRFVCVLLIVVELCMALGGLVIEALAVAAFFTTYLLATASYLKAISLELRCELVKTDLELGEDYVKLSMHLKLSPVPGFLVSKLYVTIPQHLSTAPRGGIVSVKVERLSEQPVELLLVRRTGLHTIGPLKLTVSDVLRLVETVICQEDFVTIKVPPKASMAPLARWYGMLRSSAGARTLTPGSGVEYHSTREYQPGDELRHIDWKATARIGRLHVKVFEVETPIEVAIALDASSYMFIGSPRSLFEVCADVAVALANYLIKRKDRVFFFVFADEAVRFRVEARNHRDLVNVLNAVSSVEWPRYPQPPRAAAFVRPGALRELEELLDRATAVVVLSPLLSDSRVTELAKLAERAQGRGARLIVVAPIVTFFGAGDRHLDLLYRVLRFDVLEAELRSIEYLRQSGARVIAMSPHRAMERVVEELERLRTSGAR